MLATLDNGTLENSGPTVLTEVLPDGYEPNHAHQEMQNASDVDLDIHFLYGGPPPHTILFVFVTVALGGK